MEAVMLKQLSAHAHAHTHTHAHTTRSGSAPGRTGDRSARNTAGENHRSCSDKPLAYRPHTYLEEDKTRASKLAWLNGLSENPKSQNFATFQNHGTLPVQSAAQNAQRAKPCVAGLILLNQRSQRRWVRSATRTISISWAALRHEPGRRARSSRRRMARWSISPGRRRFSSSGRFASWVSRDAATEHLAVHGVALSGQSPEPLG